MTGIPALAACVRAVVSVCESSGQMMIALTFSVMKVWMLEISVVVL